MRSKVHGADACTSTDRLTVGDVPKTPLKLGQNDILKLSFTIIEIESDQGVQPHQTFLRFYDEETGEEGIQPVRVSSSGKAKFELVCWLPNFCALTTENN